MSRYSVSISFHVWWIDFLGRTNFNPWLILDTLDRVEIISWNIIIVKKDLYLNKRMLDSRDIIIFLFLFFFFISTSAYLCIGFSRYLQRIRFIHVPLPFPHIHTLGILSSKICQLFRKCRIPVELFDKQAGFGFVKSFIGEELAQFCYDACQFLADLCPVYMKTRTFSQTVFI